MAVDRGLSLVKHWTIICFVMGTWLNIEENCVRYECVRWTERIKQCLWTIVRM